MENQTDRILRYMKEKGQITSVIALNNFHCLYLPARIHDLRKAGYSIKSKWIYTTRRKYKKYYLEEK